MKPEYNQHHRYEDDSQTAKPPVCFCRSKLIDLIRDFVRDDRRIAMSPRSPPQHEHKQNSARDKNQCEYRRSPHEKLAPCKDALTDIRHGQFEIAHAYRITRIQRASLITSQRL